MSSEEFLQIAQKAVESYRCGMEAQGSECLVALIDVLSAMLQKSESPDSGALSQVLAAMFAAQERKDYLYLADLLQYEMVPLLLEK